MSIILKPTKAEPMATSMKTEYQVRWEDVDYPNSLFALGWTDDITAIAKQIKLLVDTSITNTTVEVRHTKVMTHATPAKAFLQLHFPQKEPL